MNQKHLTVIEADEQALNIISNLSPSTEGLTNYLKELSTQQIEYLAQDVDGIKSLMSTLRTIQERPGKTFAAKLDDDTLVGFVVVKGFGQCQPELQLEVLPRFRGKGYGREIVCDIIQKIFDQTTAEKIVYRVGLYNEASIRIIESLGGILQKSSSDAENLLIRTYYIKNTYKQQ